ncbi:19138_t:CDS:1, partial [Gigaspora rosea]
EDRLSKRKRRPNYYKYLCWYSRRPKFIHPDEYINLYKRCWDSYTKNRPQINEVDDIVKNIKSDAVKKFNKNIIKVEQRNNNSS